MHLTDKRRGRFKLAADLLEQNPEAVKIIMGQCLIVRAEMMLISATIEYDAICDDFLPVEDGSVAPEYQADSVNADTGEVEWSLVEGA